MDCEGGVSKQKEGSVFLKEAWDSKIFIRKYAANLQKITLGKPWSGVFFKSAASKRTILTKFLIRLYLGQKLLSIKQEICLYCADIVIWNSQFFILLKKKKLLYLTYWRLAHVMMPYTVELCLLRDSKSKIRDACWGLMKSIWDKKNWREV